MTLRRLLIVSTDLERGVVSGGALRVRALASALARHVQVTTLSGLPVPGTRHVPWATAAESSAMRRNLARFTRQPVLGRVLLPQARAAQVRSEATQHDAVLLTHTYQWPPIKKLLVPVLFDVANVESQRSRSLAAASRPAGKRVLHLWESRRAASVWEPSVYRQAAGLFACSLPDYEHVARYHPRVLYLPHGVEVRSLYVPSPPDGPVLIVSNFNYEPNLLAVRHVLSSLVDCPAEIRRHGLAVVGRGAERLHSAIPHSARAVVTISADVPSVEPYYRRAALVLAPALAGGGAQVKVFEALGHRRVVVAPAWSVIRLPPDLQGFILAPAEGEPLLPYVASVLRTAKHLVVEAELADSQLPETWDELGTRMWDAARQWVG